MGALRSWYRYQHSKGRPAVAPNFDGLSIASDNAAAGAQIGTHASTRTEIAVVDETSTPDMPGKSFTVYWLLCPAVKPQND